MSLDSSRCSKILDITGSRSERITADIGQQGVRQLEAGHWARWRMKRSMGRDECLGDRQSERKTDEACAQRGEKERPNQASPVLRAQGPPPSDQHEHDPG